VLIVDVCCVLCVVVWIHTREKFEQSVSHKDAHEKTQSLTTTTSVNNMSVVVCCGVSSVVVVVCVVCLLV
jgi:hypothetical protein